MKKILVSLLAVMVVLSMSVPVFAAPGPGGTEHRYQGDDAVHDPSSDKYLKDAIDNTAATDGIVKIDKYLITKQGVVVPEIKFDYTIEAGTAASYDIAGKKFEVMAPVVGPRDGSSNLGTANTSGMPKFTATNANHTISGTGDSKDTIKFTDTSATKNSTVVSGDAVELDSREQYQKEQATLSFREVYFYEPGVYRYIIKEANVTGNPSGIYFDTQELDTHGEGTPKTLPDPSVPDNQGSKERILDVYVTDNGSGVLQVSSYVLHEKTNGQITQPKMGTGTGDYTTDYGTADVENDGDELTGKSKGFVNEYQTVDLDIKKEVTGNQASRDKYFEITVKVDDAVEGVDYIVSIANDGNNDTHDGSCDPASGKNAATISANQEKNNYTSRSGSGSSTDPYVYKVSGTTLKNGTAKFYLQHGQHIVIRGLPETSTYKVTENSEDYKMVKAEQYTTTRNITNYWNATDPATDTRVANKTTLKQRDKISDANGSTEADANIDGLVRTSFLNVRSGIIPTGLLFSIGGGAMIVLLAAAMLVYLNRRKARRYEA